MKLKTKITVSTLATILTIFIIAMGINTFIFYSQAKEFRDKEIYSSIEFFLSEINNATETTEIVGQDIAQAGELIYDMKMEKDAKETLPSILIEKLKKFPNLIGGGIWYEPDLFNEKYLGPYALWKDGQLAVTWNYSNEEYDYFNQSWYLYAIPKTWNRTTPRSEKRYRTAPYKDKISNQNEIFITVCTIMYSNAQEIIGISTIDWTLKSVKDLLSKLDITKSSFAVLIDKDSKKIIFHPDETYLLKDYSELPWLKYFELKVLDDKDSEIDDKIQINKQNYTLYFSKTKANFILVVAINQKEAYSVIGGIIQRNLLLTIITLLIIGIVIYFIVGKSIQPLMNIISILRGITSGEKSLHERINIKSKDEFGELANSYNHMANTIEKQSIEIKEYTENLEDKVNERTNELNKSLQEVTKLKMQQDGDYFLTSLLLMPLGTNKVETNSINIEFFVKQKKEFEFKKKKYEIGGDLCTSDSIFLESKKYTVFLNADAMGKSIQGAGGALILGSVFNAIVERTKLSKLLMSYSPERWIKETFIELHKTFEPFDGSMLVSVIFGLVDDSNGYCYYMNAEHPFAALYRDGKASFLDSNTFYRKLGTTDTEGGIIVETFQLLPGDILLLGSDGRDDILLSNSIETGRVINEDENLFLSVIEKSDSDLEKIYENLKKIGEITDDLSLLRLEYIGESQPIAKLKNAEKKILQASREFQKQGDNQKAIEFLELGNDINSDHPDVIRERMKIYLNTKSYVKICELAIPYLSMRPDDKDIIYLTSYCYKKLKKFESALDYAERLKIREPNNISYMVNLAEIHLELGNHKKAKEIYIFTREQDLNNEHVIMLEDMFRKFEN